MDVAVTLVAEVVLQRLSWLMWLPTWLIWLPTSHIRESTCGTTAGLGPGVAVAVARAFEGSIGPA